MVRKNETHDPFAHHPGLRDKIKPHDQSVFREFTLDRLQGLMDDHGLPGGWWYDDATREATRHSTLAGRRDDDIWVFAYGFLMWDPALDFAEVRRAHAPDHERQFILRDIYGGRGTPEAPGLMAALDHGAGCAGLAFRIEAAKVERETEILWWREMVAPCYHARFIPLDIAGGQIEALAFIADHDADMIDASLTRPQQIEYLTTGKGFLGTSFDYLLNVVEHLHQLDIPDPDLEKLLEAARAAMPSETSPKDA